MQNANARHAEHAPGHMLAGNQPLAFRPISYLMPWQDSYPLLVPTPSGLPHLPHGAWAHSSERLSSTAWAYQPVSFGLVF